MKTVLKYSLAVLIFLQAADIYSQNYWLPAHSPTTQFIRGAHFLDSLRGWICGDSASIYYTSNGGANWTKQDANNRDLDIMDIFFLDANYGWAISWEDQFDSENPGRAFGSFIHRTTNGGLNWTAALFPYADVFLNTIRFTDPLNGLAGGFPYNITYSTDGGMTWASPSIDSAFQAFAPVHDFSFYNSQYAFAGGGYHDIVGVLWKTTNGGLNWNSQGVGPEPIQAIQLFDSLNVIAVGGDFEYGSGIVKTTNGGINWDYRSLEILGIANSLSFRTRSEGWASLGHALIFIYTLDSGRTWQNVVTPDSVAIYDVQFTDRRNGFAVGDDGAFLKYNTAMINVEPGGANLPRTHRLFQNYPNPFNPVTKIGYELRQSGNISLKVYDISGKEVLTLKEGFERQGLHEITFNGKDLSSGIYIYKLEVNAGNSPVFSQSRKMILVK
jgi:photosystem II stability/assembly factor-like uncharacterized protein